MASHLFNDGNSQNPSWGGKNLSIWNIRRGWNWHGWNLLYFLRNLIFHYYVLENDDLIPADLIHLFFFMPPVSWSAPCYRVLLMKRFPVIQKWSHLYEISSEAVKKKKKLVKHRVSFGSDIRPASWSQPPWRLWLLETLACFTAELLWCNFEDFDCINQLI